MSVRRIVVVAVSMTMIAVTPTFGQFARFASNSFFAVRSNYFFSWTLHFAKGFGFRGRCRRGLVFGDGLAVAVVPAIVRRVVVASVAVRGVVVVTVTMTMVTVSPTFGQFTWFASNSFLTIWSNYFAFVLGPAHNCQACKQQNLWFSNNLMNIVL